MLSVIDADTHIAEPQVMWDLIDREMYPRRPVLVSVPEDTLYKSWNAFWLIDGNIFPKPAGRGGFRLVTPSVSRVQSSRSDIQIGGREITNIDARLADMDRLGIEVQVVYPTLFLVYITDDAELDVALCRAYNRWLAQACSQAMNRLKWVIVPPLRSIEHSIEEIRWGKEHGAVGVFFRGIEGNLTLDHPYFFPVYAEASRLDLPICVHSGAGAPALNALFDLDRNRQWAASGVPPLYAFSDIVYNEIPEKFPDLRFGFIEASAGWVPFLIHKLKRHLRQRWKFSSPVELFRQYRLYVACESDEDVPYLLHYIGENHVLIGSDYGHNDPAEEPRLLASMQSREGLGPTVLKKILSENPKRFYSL